MEFIFRRSYRGPLKAVILDWAGTTVDYGCFAPVVVFLEVFKRRGIAINVQQARGPMGLAKQDHIRAIARMPPVAEQWAAVHGQPCAEPDIEAMFQDFVPAQSACLSDYADLIPGTLEAIADFRARGLKIGSTTGYSRQMMEVLLPEARRRGYVPDTWVCPSDVPAGRPAPWMCFQNAMNLQCYPLAAFVKIGDTIPDIEEGLNAGMWSIGVAKSGNEIGLSEQDLAALDPAVLAARLQAVYQRMYQAGAHYVVDTLAAVPALLDAIESRLRQGEQP